MKHLIAPGFLMVGMTFHGLAAADSRIDHFEGESSATLAEAVANFSAYNGKLAALLAQPALSPTDLGIVHQLTYTLENALEKINQDLEALAETLEEVHLASEKSDAEGVRTHGRKEFRSSVVNR